MAETKGGAFIGYPRGPRPKVSPAKSYEDTWLDDLIKGFLGESEVGGSVLDPEDKVRRNRVNDIGQQAGILLNLPQIAGAGKAAALALGGLGGAIRLHGAKDLIASHVTSSPKEVARSGYLDAPSIGITSRRGSEYSGLVSPQLIFSAGKLDPKDAPYPTVFLNRDGYIGSPSGRNPFDWDDEYFAQRFKSRMDEVKRHHGQGWPDLRAAHSFPLGSQGLAISASPNFRSFAEFEKHPAGAATLRMNPKDKSRSWAEIDKALRALQLEDTPNPGIAKEYARKFYSLPREYTPVQMLDLMERASRAGSGMAELKHYGKVPISPEDTAIYMGKELYPTSLEAYAPFRDAGFPIFTAYHLGHEPGRFMGETLEHLLPRVASDKGGFNLPKDLKLPEKRWPNGGDPHLEHAQAWNAFIEPKAGGSPPLSVAKIATEDPLTALNGLPQNQQAHKLKELAASGQLTPDQATELMKGYGLDDYFHPEDLPWKVLSAPKLAEPEVNDLGGWQLTPENKVKFHRVFNNADEYLIVMDDFFKKHNIVDPKQQNEAMTLVSDMYDAGYHKIPNWHSIVEEMLGAGLLPQKAELPRFAKSHEVYGFIDKQHAGGFKGLADKVNQLADKYLQDAVDGTDLAWLEKPAFWQDYQAVDTLLGGKKITPEMAQAYKIWLDFLSKPAK